ncbi:betaine/proline/choline family ABC transporter ATP-binding protein [Gracilibacillus salitolerans]|uniref:Quaternary amine transport ATP-binding protein n=1 Tax=Gracilibacillus salitolerans TaxID=2663022 RepID=A0A5Q2TEW4_9BACI|nr:betaine/proline/choline family ABC transporter ATP-binding protein [Gracilibacillus salitolerans]QGH33196.1 betaine/proline/choline family ABC transporter ATP-binding protein [Gracilibacillus salitolerans]
MIQLKGIHKVYDDGFQALQDINLTFEEGKINVLIGPSGCGKTTTMKLLNRLTDYTEGQILIDGKDIQQINPIELRRQMGYVIQNIGLFPHMTIFDNVATVPKLLKWDKQKIKQKVDELLRMVNLDPEVYRDRYPAELSGGQQQRIGVIRALAAEPSTILMDEPFSALDPISREQLQEELVRLQQEINKTIVFVTHDMDEAIKIADQIIIMKSGHVVQKGSPQEILANPANDFVKEFIGEERLGSALPPVKDLMTGTFATIDITQSLDEAIQTMIDQQDNDIPIVDQDHKYVGMLDLFSALKQKERKIKDVLTNQKTIVETTAMEQVISDELLEHQAMIPVVSNDDKVVGIIKREKWLEVLQHFYQLKRGGQ